MQTPNLCDQAILYVDNILRTLLPPSSRATKRAYPAKQHDKASETLNASEKKHSAGLMRVNHTGEVCAQALYHGQALTSTNDGLKRKLHQAAEEEVDHLGWCEKRLKALDASPSLLNPLWYGLSLGLGMVAGISGDAWNLGFVAETEKQVSNHLRHHLSILPEKDIASRQVVEVMLEDEEKHANDAINAGAAALPQGIKKAMSWMSTCMTQSSYYI